MYIVLVCNLLFTFRCQIYCPTQTYKHLSDASHQFDRCLHKTLAKLSWQSCIVCLWEVRFDNTARTDTWLQTPTLTMKLYVLAATIFASLSIAAPSELLRRQDTSNELIGGGWFSFFSSCKPIIFIFARGSTESGNMVQSISWDKWRRLTVFQGDSVGPLLCKALKHQAGETQVACQGVGGDYTASMKRPSNGFEVIVLNKKQPFQIIFFPMALQKPHGKRPWICSRQRTTAGDRA